MKTKEGLEIGDLRAGVIYKCLITGRNVLKVEHGGLVYNDINGKYENISIYKGQLSEIITP